MNEQTVTLSDIEKIFNSDNQELVLQSLELIRDVGNEHIFEFLVRQLLTQNNHEIRQAIVDCLVDVKNPACAKILCSCVEKPEYSAHKSLLFSIAWQSALDFSSLSGCAVESICTGNFETAFEAHTLLEHVADAIPAGEKQEYSRKLKKALLQCADFQKEMLINESIALLEEIDNEAILEEME
jgi:hypothetical protein